MAIKISGTTVIDNSCNVTNANTFTATTFVGDGSGLTGVAEPVPVLKPENTLPADGATGCLDGTVLCGSEYFSLYDKTHTCTCFQVSLCSDFSTCNFITCELAGACRSLTINPESDGLVESTQHFFRLRYEDADGCCSNFSDATCFSTGSYFDPTLGAANAGGFYMGTICASGSCYYLIMAPNATGCACCKWKNVRTCSGVGNEECDGYGNTYDHLDNSGHPAGNWTATRSIDGFCDWYLPAICELVEIYTNKACAPAGEGFPTGSSIAYWSSTEFNTTLVCRIDPCNGGIDVGNKQSTTCRLRAVRRIPF